MTLFSANGRSDDIVVEGRVLSPAQGIDEALRITVTGGPGPSTPSAGRPVRSY